MHQGIDYDGNFGDDIRAVGAGRVVKAGWWANGYGISVLVNHGGNFYSHYAHMQHDYVAVGQRVKAGQVIGEVGATGDATGSHLHFEVWRGMWNQIDPRAWLRSHGLRAGC
jgi:murein DD-endopeptidase MepM/ murein hydrolase activator NlpD